MSLSKSNNLSIVYSDRIDAVTDPSEKFKSDNGWCITLNKTQPELVKTILEKIPEYLLPLISTVIMSGSTNGKAKQTIHDSIHNGKNRSRPSAARQAISLIDLSELNPKMQKTLDVFGVDAACSSGIKAMQIAEMILEKSDGLVMIVGAECASIQLMRHIFDSLGAMSHDDEWLVPFSEHPNGIMLGDGAGVIMLASGDFAKEHSLDIEATVDSIGFATIPSHPTQPSDPALSLQLIMDTIARSGKQISDFAHWDAHATGTPLGDKTEMELHDNIMKDVPITAYKQQIGHTLGASGLIETAAAIKNNKGSAKKTIIKTSFGFGGQNGILVLTVN
jgi:3-oxoacyl-[acyl-carrier-protein] synthase II